LLCADIYPQVVDVPLRCRGFEPTLTDSEVTAMEIAGEFLGKGRDKGIWRISGIIGTRGFPIWDRGLTLPSTINKYK